MKKSGFIILGIVIIVLVAGAYWLGTSSQNNSGSSAPSAQDDANATAASDTGLTNQASPSSVNLHDMQVQCANEAAATYQQVETPSVVGWTSTYSNHWNENLQKCFILINNSGLSNGQVVNGTNLSDALEQKIYADYKTNSKWVICFLSPDGETDASTTSCGSRAEFDSFVNPFMND